MLSSLLHKTTTSPIIAPHSFLEGQTGGAWGPSKKQCIFGNLGALDRKAISLLHMTVHAVGYLEAVTLVRHHGDIAHNVATWSGVTEFCGS